MTANALTVPAKLRMRAGEPCGAATCAGEWPVFWNRLCARLRGDGYRPNTLRLYRQVLRDLRVYLHDRHGVAGPVGLTAGTAKAYLEFLCQKNVSWSWMATAIAVLRNTFDRLCGMAVTAGMVTPRRNWPLPETLSPRELRLLLDALPNPRDRLLVALLSACGLRVSEACRIRWTDFDAATSRLRVDDPSGLRSRTVPVPAGLLGLFQGMAALSRPTDPMICGSRSVAAGPRPLSARQAERIVQAAAGRAGILKRVTPTGLRHTYALRRLIAGDNIRELQDALGHRSVETTLRYQACLPPKVVSPADPVPPPTVFQEAAEELRRLAAMVPSPPPCREAVAVVALPATAAASSEVRVCAGGAPALKSPTFQQGP